VPVCVCVCVSARVACACTSHTHATPPQKHTHTHTNHTRTHTPACARAAPRRTRTTRAGAVTSWHYVHDEGLARGLVQLLRFLHDGIGAERWAALVAGLEPGVRAKLEQMCR
jgi:hypothetical protein